MDAVEFLKENGRMCKAFDSCSGKNGGEMCELYVKSNEKGLSCADYASAYPEEAVKIIEKWSKDHPRKTRQDKFLEAFPKVKRAVDGVIIVCPNDIDQEFSCPLRWGGSSADKCPGCQKKYWFEEVD